MALEALSTNELLNIIIYDALSTLQTPPPNYNYSNHPPPPPETLSAPEISGLAPQQLGGEPATVKRCHRHLPESPENEAERRQDMAVQGRKKRRRRPKVVKNKEEAESQRMTHITVERNRRKQMNEHLSVLKSLMPESYVQRGDQASIVGGAIDYVKELEHLLQSLEAEKHLVLRATAPPPTTTNAATANAESSSAPFAQFFSYPQYTWFQIPNEYTSMNKDVAMADIEVTLIETHANIRVLCGKNPRQLSKLVAGFHSISLSILHLNVTTLDHLVLYSISAKVEEGCQMNSADEIAGAVNQMLRIIEEEEANIHHHDYLFIHQNNPSPSSYL